MHAAEKERYAAANRPFHILKFGGTSVDNPERIKHVVELCRRSAETARILVVVSALGGVTNRLIDAINEALARSHQHEAILEEIRLRHDRVVEQLVMTDEQLDIRGELGTLWNNLGDLLDGVYLLRECTPRTWDAIISAGERASAPLLAAAFRACGQKAKVYDATECIRTDDTFKEANVNFTVTNGLIKQTLGAVPDDEIAIVTGFIATTDSGVVTTLGRSGSDYTATILAAALDADQVVIWTDVDGVLSADPHLVEDAFPLDRLNYWEAGELAYFGARVLHPRTMRPLQQKGIPLLIKNTLKPEAPGSLISQHTGHLRGHVKAVTSIRGMAVVTLEGSGLLGVPGVAGRALSALASRNINVLMISQASSEQSICFVIKETDRVLGVSLLEKAFEAEKQRGDVSRVTAQSDVAVVAVVGENMRNRPGIAGRMFSTLGRNGINVLAIAQGSSERNISVAIAGSDVKRAVKALHIAFPMARDRAHVFVIGTGNVGATLLRFMEQQTPKLIDGWGLDLCLVGAANVFKMSWNSEGMPYEGILERLKEGEDNDLDIIVERLIESRLERLIMVDVTASDVVAQRYAELLSAGVAVVTPNKRANTAPYNYYLNLQELAVNKGAPYLYETTVGAALPVVATLRDLVRTGDRIVKIEGIVSGTLAYVFNSLMEGKTFSEAVLDAKRSGYTEPDPREDLAGRDVQRKMLILAREMGLNLELADIIVTSLIPEHLADVSLDEFLSRLHEVDEAWRIKIQEYQSRGEGAQYFGLIENGRIDVGVKSVAANSPFNGLHGTDNMIAFTTERYNQTPLVVRGPGAGPEVTAGGIFADIVKAAELLM